MSKTNNSGRIYINKQGVRVMRITDVIKVLAKDQIAVWANMLGFQRIDYRKELDRTAHIGTLFHAVLEDYMDPKRIAVVDYDEYEVYGFESQLEATNALKSFFKWYDGIKDRYKVKFTEKTIVGEKVGGTIDTGIAGFKDPDKVILVDYKTSNGFYLSQFLQLAGYASLYEEEYGKDTVEGVMVVRADKKRGHKAKALMIPRERLDVFMTGFWCLYNVAYMTRSLETSWLSLADEIE